MKDRWTDARGKQYVSDSSRGRYNEIKFKGAQLLSGRVILIFFKKLEKLLQSLLSVAVEIGAVRLKNSLQLELGIHCLLRQKIFKERNTTLIFGN